jgi:hypothetical protein
MTTSLPAVGRNAGKSKKFNGRLEDCFLLGAGA